MVIYSACSVFLIHFICVISPIRGVFFFYSFIFKVNSLKPTRGRKLLHLSAMIRINNLWSTGIRIWRRTPLFSLDKIWFCTPSHSFTFSIMHNSTIQRASIIVRITLFWCMVWRQNGNTLNKLKFILALPHYLQKNLIIMCFYCTLLLCPSIRTCTQDRIHFEIIKVKECYCSCCCYLKHSHKINVWTKMNVCSKLWIAQQKHEISWRKPWKPWTCDMDKNVVILASTISFHHW